MRDVTEFASSAGAIIAFLLTRPMRDVTRKLVPVVIDLARFLLTRPMRDVTSERYGQWRN